MSKTYDENAKFFYPQNENPFYTEKVVLKISLLWLIDACENNENRDFRKELRALLTTTSGKVHRIANLIRYVISLKKDDSKYSEHCDCISKYAQTIITCNNID